MAIPMEGTFSSKHSTVTYTSQPASVPSVEDMHETVRVTDTIVTPALSSLLAKILATVDASIPNKDQNRGVKKIVRESFDNTYFSILSKAYPDIVHAPTEGSYSLEPEPDKRLTNAIPER